MLLSALGTSIANVGLPTLAHAFNVSFQQVQWVVLSYLLAITTLIVSAGRLGDVVGRRRLLLAGLALFTAGSLLSGLASTFALLIIGRAGQGLGAAAMMALTMAFVGDTVPKARVGSAMGLLGTMSAVGTALGPSVGGFLISTFGWPSIFFLNAWLGIAVLGLAYRCLPADSRDAAASRPRFDHVGTVLLAVTLAAYALSLTSGPSVPGMHAGLLPAVALAGAGLFLLAESKSSSPLVRLAMFRNPVLSTGFAMSALVTTVVMATLVVGPFYLAFALGLDALKVGLVMACGPFVAALAGVPAGRVVDRLGPRRMTIAGLAGMAAGALALAMMPAGGGVPGYLGALALITAGYALFQAANNTAVMADIAPSQRGLTSGLLNLARNLGLITGASLMGKVFAVGTGAPDIASAPAAAVARGMHATFAVACALMLIALGIGIAGQLRARPHP